MTLVDLAGVCSGDGPCDTSPNDHGGKNWVSKAGGFPDWFHAIINAMRRKGADESKAVQMAWGIVRNWARGGGNVTPETRAKAAAMVARLDAMRGGAHLTAAAAPAVDLAVPFDPSKHPRAPKGASNGGKFTANSGSNSSSKPVKDGDLPPDIAAQVRDFQKRMGLAVTGRADAATLAKIHAVQTAKGGGGKGGGGSSAKKKAAAAASKALKAKQAAAAKALKQKQTAATRAAKVKAAAAKKTAAASVSAAKKTATAQTTAATKQRTALVAAVNKLTPAQRAAYKAKNPKAPAGYEWVGSRLLTTTQATAVTSVAKSLGGTPR